MIGAWLLWLVACTCRSPGPAASEGPDLLLLTVDTLRADHLGFMGHAGARTPHLDALASRGRVFERATTPLPRTTPALASALTGRYPRSHGSVEVGDPIDDVPTLARVLSDAGWATLGMSAMSVAGPDQGLDAGFDHFEVHHDARASDLVDRTIAALPSGRRFVWVHFADPHFPYLPPGDDDEPCRAAGERVAAGERQRVELFVDLDGEASRLRSSCERLYDAEIAEVDRAVGRLLESLGDEVWVLMSADHGEHLGEQGLFFEHGPTVHDADLHIPLVVAGPGVAPGRDDRLAQLVDLLPTATALAGVDAPDHEGLDLLGPTRRAQAPAMSGSALQARLHTSPVAGRERRWCLHGPEHSRCVSRRGVTYHRRATDPELRRDLGAEALGEAAAALDQAAATWGPEQAREYSLRDETHKLVLQPVWQGGYEARLYTGQPTDETVDRSDEHPQRLDALRDGLTPWFDDLPTAAPRDDDTLQQLEALGYVDE